MIPDALTSSVFHVLSFEGPDPYARVGGLGTRVEGLAEGLVALGFETHLWFVGDPKAPPQSCRDGLRLHRACQGLGSGQPGAVYEDEDPKVETYTRTVPHALLKMLLESLLDGRRAIVMAEDWQTAAAVIRLDELLRRAGLRERVTILWNANNTFGFQTIDLHGLAEASSITAVSRYMRTEVQRWGVDAVVIPNGIDAASFRLPDEGAVSEVRRLIGDRLILAKMARWDPAKGWDAAIRLVAEAKARGAKPLLIARGGTEAYGAHVIRAVARGGLRLKSVRPNGGGVREAVQSASEADVLSIETHVDPENRRLLFRSADAVLANSSHEPFGLVGLETMAVGGIAVTGCTGEDYAIAGENALVLRTEDPREFFALHRPLAADRSCVLALRRAAQATAARYRWIDVVRRNLLPWVEVQEALQGAGPADEPDLAAFGLRREAAEAHSPGLTS